jgi:outer membrane receptor protein involved in Fe transport
LRPEKSRTFDVGLEQRLAGGRLRAEVTFFHHEYKDLITYSTIDYTTFAGTFVNLGKTRARGLEAVVEAAPSRLLRLTGQITRLDGEVQESGNAFDAVYAEGAELLRRPRNQASGTVSLGSGRVSGAVSAVYVGERADSDFLGLGLLRNDAYTRVDARLRATLARGLELVLVSENLLDREYMEVLGYPALGRSVRLGLRYRTGDNRP